MADKVGLWNKIVRAAQKYTILGDEEPQRFEIGGWGAIPHEYSRRQDPRGSIYAPGRAIDIFGGGGLGSRAKAAGGRVLRRAMQAREAGYQGPRYAKSVAGRATRIERKALPEPGGMDPDWLATRLAGQTPPPVARTEMDILADTLSDIATRRRKAFLESWYEGVAPGKR